jgi:predicted molibdopterin-dependent oxidoreductase YjgC
VIEITVDGKTITVAIGTTLAAALLNEGVTTFRNSVTGEARQPVCGMGVCFECRVTVDGVAHQRSCLIPIRDGMDVITGE